MTVRPKPPATFSPGQRARPIRTTVRRESRITPAQRRALIELWPRFAADDGDGAIDPTALFGRKAALVIDIGFGDGESLLAQALAAPERDFIGIEVHRPGIGALLLKLDAHAVANVRLIEGDARTVLRDRLPAGCAEAVQLFFPDPWPKKRHHKRRLVQPEFAAAVARVLAPGGVLHVATDWEDYARHAREVIDASGGFAPAEPAAARPASKYERRGVAQGRRIWDIVRRKRVQAEDQ